MTQFKDNINSHTGKHLTYEERVKIEGYKELGYSNRAIARILKRAPQTINNAVNQETVRTIKQRQIHNDKVYFIKSTFAIAKTLDVVQCDWHVIHS